MFKKETQRRLSGAPPSSETYYSFAVSYTLLCEAHYSEKLLWGPMFAEAQSLKLLCFSKCVTFSIEVHTYQQAESMFLTTGETKK